MTYLDDYQTMNTTMNDTEDLVLSCIKNGVLTLTLNAPKAGNALDVAMTEALADALESANALPDVHCVLVRSSGKHFCTGGNVKDMDAGTDLMQGTVEAVRERLTGSLHRITRALYSLQVPSIAAVNGAAVGAGFDVALMCDLRIASVNARFAESFLRLGLVSGIGGAWFLARIVGAAKAMELTLTSEFIDAQAAFDLRIVSHVVPNDVLHTQAQALAEKIAASPPRALRMAKQLVRQSAEAPLSIALEIAASMQAILLCGDEHKLAVRRFLG